MDDQPEQLKDNTFHWYAVCTRPRHEKKAATFLAERAFEYYLPLTKEVRQWSDRRKWVEAPLIRGYVFVHIYPYQCMDVLQVHGVSRFVCFNRSYAIVPDFQIEALRRIVNQRIPLNSIDYIKEGELVEVFRGPLKGVIGKVQSIRNTDRFIISLDAVKTAFSVEINQNYLRKLNYKKRSFFSVPLGVSDGDSFL
jgi:transcription antitermination factor NusG